MRSTCSVLSPVEKGGVCVSSTQCLGGLDCSPSGICGGDGAYCFDTNMCQSGCKLYPAALFLKKKCADHFDDITQAQCVRSRCAARESALGSPCTADNQCAADPNTGVTPSCSFSADSICGGEGTYCSVGQEGYCAQGYTCQGGSCTKKTTNLCASNNDCGPSRTCSYGVCGGLNAPCTPRSGSSTSANCATDCQSPLERSSGRKTNRLTAYLS